MHTVELDPDVVARLEKLKDIANNEQGDYVQRVVNEAMRDYLRQLEFQKLEEEQKAFQAQHPDLVDKYLGMYVAFHQGRLVDVDENERTLLIRIRQHFPNTLVGIFPVDETSEMRVHRHLSVRLSPPNRQRDL